MKTNLVLYILLIWQKNQLLAFEPSEFDYCTIDCNGETHTACKCEETEATNEIITDDIDNFRAQMVAIHNEFRNRIASGEEEGCPAASNMNLLNYDLELEYISRCHAKVAGEGHDRCRKKHDQDINAGQNIFGNGPNKATPAKYNKTYREALTSWYDEIKDIQPSKEAYLQNFHGGSAGHFTQMVWAEMTHVGCTMAWIPTNAIMKNMLICNYAGKDGGGNMLGSKVYSFGEPCSQCPDTWTCDKKGKFPALCGKDESSKETAPNKEDAPHKENAPKGDAPREDAHHGEITPREESRKEDGTTQSADLGRSGYAYYVKVTITRVVLYLCIPLARFGGFY